jgi:hypothetical protein
MLRVHIARITPELRQTFPLRNELRAGEAVVYVAGRPQMAGSVAKSWGPFVDRTSWTLWDWEGNVLLRGSIGKLDDRTFQMVKQGDDPVVLYGSRQDGLIGKEPTVTIAGHEFGLPSNLRDIRSFEFGSCSFRWRWLDGLPDLHLFVSVHSTLLPFVGFGYDLWKGAYFGAVKD